MGVVRNQRLPKPVTMCRCYPYCGGAAMLRSAAPIAVSIALFAQLSTGCSREGPAQAADVQRAGQQPGADGAAVPPAIRARSAMDCEAFRRSREQLADQWKHIRDVASLIKWLSSEEPLKRAMGVARVRYMVRPDCYFEPDHPQRPSRNSTRPCLTWSSFWQRTRLGIRAPWTLTAAQRT